MLLLLSFVDWSWIEHADQEGEAGGHPTNNTNMPQA